MDFLQNCEFSRNELMEYGALVGKGFLSFFVYFVLSLVIRGLFKRVSRRLSGQKQAAADLLAQGSGMFFMGLGVISALSEWGFDVRGLIATLGLTGFALGLALKDAISNVISGILLIVYAPFHVGSKVRISGKEGLVRSIEIKHTVLEEEGTGVLHILPNSKVLSEIISILG